MEISDVVGRIREQSLQHSLHLAAIQSQLNALERFTWNLVRALAELEQVVITLDVPEGDEEDAPSDPTLF